MITYIPTCSALCTSGTMAGTDRSFCGEMRDRRSADFRRHLSPTIILRTSIRTKLDCLAVEHPLHASVLPLLCAAHVNITNAASPSTRPLGASAAKFPHNALSLVTREMRFHPNIRHRHALAGRHAKCPCSDSSASQSSLVRDAIASASHCRGIRGSSVAGN